MLNLQKNKGFSLAEMMVVMLMLSIIFAAAAPILTKRATQTTISSIGVPIGTVIIWTTEQLPQGSEKGKWLECNGQSTDDYPELKSIVGASVPDFRGVFLRGEGSKTFSQNNGTIIGNSSTTYSSESLGDIQGDGMRNIYGWVQGFDLDRDSYHSISGAFSIGWSSTGGPDHSSGRKGELYQYLNAERIAPIRNEIRPINIAVKYIIKAKS